MNQAAFSTKREGLHFLDDLASFTFNGSPSRREVVNSVPYIYNEFWTAKQRDSNSLHEISYRACFKAQLPEFFIQRLTSPGDTVFDPFMGRGTTILQALLMGRDAIGNDINPLAALLCRPRASPPLQSAVAKRLDALDWSHPVSDTDDLLVFYHRETLSQILALRSYLLERELSGEIDQVDDWIRMVALNRLTGHSSGFFSVYSLPPNQAVSVSSQRRINEKRDQIPPARSVPAIILKKTRSLLKDGHHLDGSAVFTTRPADQLPLPNASIDLVVTSPPFLDIVQYAADNWLRCWFSGIDVGSVEIAMHRKPEAWGRFILSVIRELGRVVRPGGHIAFEVGEVRGGKVELDKIVLDCLDDTPFTPLAVLVNCQSFTKTANCWGVSNNQAGTNTNRIVVARRV